MVALLLVPTAVALRGQVRIYSRNARTASRRTFEFTTRWQTRQPQGFVSRFPHADVSQAPVLWRANKRWAGETLGGAQRPAANAGSRNSLTTLPGHKEADSGGCRGASDTTRHPRSRRAAYWTDRHPTLFDSAWSCPQKFAANVEVQLEDGSRSKLPVVEGFFLGSFDKGTKFRSSRLRRRRKTRWRTSSSRPRGLRGHSRTLAQLRARPKCGHGRKAVEAHAGG